MSQPDQGRFSIQVLLSEDSRLYPVNNKSYPACSPHSACPALPSPLQCSCFLSAPANHCPSGLHLHGRATASSWIWLSPIMAKHSTLVEGVLVRWEGDRWHLCVLPYHPSSKRILLWDQTTRRSSWLWASGTLLLRHPQRDDS